MIYGVYLPARHENQIRCVSTATSTSIRTISEICEVWFAFAACTISEGIGFVCFNRRLFLSSMFASEKNLQFQFSMYCLPLWRESKDEREWWFVLVAFSRWLWSVKNYLPARHERPWWWSVLYYLPTRHEFRKMWMVASTSIHMMSNVASVLASLGLGFKCQSFSVSGFNCQWKSVSGHNCKWSQV